MRRNIFCDKINTAHGNRKNELSYDIFGRNFGRTDKWLVKFQTLLLSANYCILTKMHMFSLLRRKH